jgi:hypothetical protein
MLVPFAIRADLIGFQLEKTLDGSLVLRRPLGGGVRGSPGHDDVVTRKDGEVRLRCRKIRNEGFAELTLRERCCKVAI